MLSPLHAVLGNATAERTLLHLHHYGELHASAIASDHDVALTPIRRQLERFERAGLLVSREVGRSRLFQFNPRSPIAQALREFIKVVYDRIPPKERENIFAKRRRPRRVGKPVISKPTRHEGA